MADYTLFLLHSRAHTENYILTEYIRNHSAKVQRHQFSSKKSIRRLRQRMQKEHEQQNLSTGDSAFSRLHFRVYLQTIRGVDSEGR